MQQAPNSFKTASLRLELETLSNARAKQGERHMVSMSYGKEKIIRSVREKIIKEKDICEHCFYPLCLFFPQRTPLISRQSILKHFLNLKKKQRNEKEKKNEGCSFWSWFVLGGLVLQREHLQHQEASLFFPLQGAVVMKGVFQQFLLLSRKQTLEAEEEFWR